MNIKVGDHVVISGYDGSPSEEIPRRILDVRVWWRFPIKNYSDIDVFVRLETVANDKYGDSFWRPIYLVTPIEIDQVAVVPE